MIGDRCEVLLLRPEVGTQRKEETGNHREKGKLQQIQTIGSFAMSQPDAVLSAAGCSLAVHAG